MWVAPIAPLLLNSKQSQNRWSIGLNYPKMSIGHLSHCQSLRGLQARRIDPSPLPVPVLGKTRSATFGLLDSHQHLALDMGRLSFQPGIGGMTVASWETAASSDCSSVDLQNELDLTGRGDRLGSLRWTCQFGGLASHWTGACRVGVLLRETIAWSLSASLCSLLVLSMPSGAFVSHSAFLLLPLELHGGWPTGLSPNNLPLFCARIPCTLYSLSFTSFPQPDNTIFTCNWKVIHIEAK